MSTRDFSWDKGGRFVRLTTYHPRSVERQENPGPQPTRNPLGHLGLLREVVTLLLQYRSTLNTVHAMTAYGESKGMLHVYHQASLVLVSEEVRCQFLTQLIYTPYPWNGRLGEIPRRSEYSRRGKISFSCRESEGDSQAFN